MIDHSSSDSRPGMYSKLTSNITGLLGATLGLPGADVRPFGNANYSTEIYIRELVYKRSSLTWTISSQWPRML